MRRRLGIGVSVCAGGSQRKLPPATVEGAGANPEIDVRAFVAGGRVLAAIERRAPAGEWRTNVSGGAAARALDLPPRWEEWAIRAAAAVGADYAGVDLLPSNDGTAFVLEVNGIPGWEGLQRATGIDVAGAIVAVMEARVQKAAMTAEVQTP